MSDNCERALFTAFFLAIVGAILWLATTADDNTETGILATTSAIPIACAIAAARGGTE
ncbi:MAG TPA: hypothetical protein VFJ19_09400 [Nocardioidaceae bacterium]|nr:hypothetical protein [Nocardioidaceae bacterium]